MLKKVDNYKYDSILSRMAKDYGSINKGKEEPYEEQLFAMESNMLKIHRKNKSCNSRRALEAIKLCLLTIEGYIQGISYDFSKFENEENKKLLYALQMSCDPFTNKELANDIRLIYNTATTEGLKECFTSPIRCLIRLDKSINMWIEKGGSDGYFDFIEPQIGMIISNDDEMIYKLDLDD